MTKTIKISFLFMILLFLVSQINSTAQIHDIKEKSSSNKTKHSSSSSSDRSSSSSGSGDDIANECLTGCLSEVFSSIFESCLTSLFTRKDKDEDNYSYNNNYSNPSYKNKNQNNEPDIQKDTTNVIEDSRVADTDSINYNTNPIEITDSINYDENNDIEHNIDINKNMENDLIEQEKSFTDSQDDSDIGINNDNQEITSFPNVYSSSENNYDLYLDIRANFDLSFHKGSDRNYTHVTYLPGLRANILVFCVDFRYNILTEYTDNNPDSFKSWELLFLLNIPPYQDFKVTFGAGIHREINDNNNSISFTEYYLGTKIPIAKKDYFDADIRVSVDHKTNEFPFFETGCRFNKSIINSKSVSTHIALGFVYQNYYQSYDICGVRGGLVFNIH